MPPSNIVSIRLAQPEDAEQMLEIYAPIVKDTIISFELEVPSINDYSQRVENVLQRDPWLVCEWNDKIVGYAYAGKHRERSAYSWNRETSVYVHHDHRKKKVGTALYYTLIELLRVQGYSNLLAGIALPNSSSIRLHERLGFKPLGIYHNIGYKLGAYQDVGWWEMFLCKKEDPPRTIRNIRDIAYTSTFDMIKRNGEEQIIT